MESLLANEFTLQIILFLVLIGIAWFMLRFVFGLMKRLFTLGCMAILASVFW